MPRLDLYSILNTLRQASSDRGWKTETETDRQTETDKEAEREVGGGGGGVYKDKAANTVTEETKTTRLIPTWTLGDFCHNFIRLYFKHF